MQIVIEFWHTEESGSHRHKCVMLTEDDIKAVAKAIIDKEYEGDNKIDRLSVSVDFN